MRTSDFYFELPDELIAEHPAKERDESRLMVISRKTSQIKHLIFKDIVDYFEEGDALILNDTKVFPGRLFGGKEKTNAEIEVLITRVLDPLNKKMDCIVDPARKVRKGNKIYFGDPQNPLLEADVEENTTSRGRILRFLSNEPYEKFIEVLKSIGTPPLPKYIQREPVKSDSERYQTIYAKEKSGIEEGTVAAPAAGLHFSKHVLKRLEIKGVKITQITLNIGLGIFAPVEVEDLSKHRMNSENFFIGQQACDIINDSLKHKKKVCAVGNSTVRALESSIFIDNKIIPPNKEWTNKFIFPPYKFGPANSLITNFHMAKSTSLMLSSAFGGYDLVMKAYKEAIKEGYRFYSYGDAMLIVD